MKTLKYIALAALTISFAACEQEDFTPSVQDDADAVKITATIGALQTRVAYDDNGVTNFTNGDAIKVTNTMRASKSEATYTTTDGVSWTTTDAFVWNGGIMNNQFRAWYPATASYEKFTLPTNQSTDTENADWMTASTDEIRKPDDCLLNLKFQHRLAKVTVTITQWNNEFENADKTITEPKIYTKGTAVEVSYGTGTDGADEYTSDGTHTAITPSTTGQTYTAIVAPLKYDFNDKFMTFTVDGQEMTVFAKNGTLTGGLQPGNHYTFDLTVGKNAVEITEVKVTDWNKVDLNGGVAKECEHETTIINGTCAVCGKPVYVDLGLSVNWATVNIGATKPEEAGDFFAWGETEPKETFTKENYTAGSKYNAMDGLEVLEATDDAAIQNWGNGWRMPTSEEQEELLDANNCTWTWTTVNGVTGYQITSEVPGYEGNSIFLPFKLFISAVGSTVQQSAYWSSSIYTEYNQWTTASDIWFHGSMHHQADQVRESGLLIRPVREK